MISKQIIILSLCCMIFLVSCGKSESSAIRESTYPQNETENEVLKTEILEINESQFQQDESEISEIDKVRVQMEESRGQAELEEKPLDTKTTIDVNGNENVSSNKSVPDISPEEIDEPDLGMISVTISIRCDMAVNNWEKLNKSIQDERIVPKSGVILRTSLKVNAGETVFNALSRACRENKIHMDSTAAGYVEGINNLYEFDGGSMSGWMYSVNREFAKIGSTKYALKNGDVVEWHYTCEMGRDLGQEWNRSDYR